ncbi:MAG: hypothetical protein ACYCU0_01605 [Solirubrobacteraceae bacterium]
MPAALEPTTATPSEAPYETALPSSPVVVVVASRDAELAARRSLRAQIARLDGELGRLAIEGFPHVSTWRSAGRPRFAQVSERCAPRLASLAELEARRDELVRRLREAQERTAARVEHERRARALLRAMQLEPGRYRFVRLRAADLGEAGCGVWHVRPRLGVIGMLAGWWQVKLSSGCPLATAAAESRRPQALRCGARAAAAAGASRARRSASSRARVADGR